MYADFFSKSIDMISFELIAVSFLLDISQNM